MKHLRLILLLLAVCFTQISFSQDLSKKWDEEKNSSLPSNRFLQKLTQSKKLRIKSVVCWKVTASTSQNKRR